jgi:hypothetical protein
MHESTKLNRIARELNDHLRAQNTDSPDTERLDRWLATLVAYAASDLLLVEGTPPCMRVDGEVRRIETGNLDGPEIEAAVLPALTHHALQLYRESFIADSSYRIPGIGRFRINLHREQGRAAAAIRVLPTRVPALANSIFRPRSNRSRTCPAAWCSLADPLAPANPPRSPR